MLDIIFYPTQIAQTKYVEVSEDLYEWLARSQFSKIGHSIPHKIEIDGEEETVTVVELNSDNRSQFRLFFLEAVAEESDLLLTKLRENMDKEEYQKATYRLSKLQELRKGIENIVYQYMQRF